ncbi:MAG: hypothetical protein ABIO70_17695 [Pseudomonadota bacterium]
MSASLRRALERRPHVWLLGQAVLLAVLLTWPVVVQPGRLVLGAAVGDTMKHLWTLDWLRESLSQGVLPFHTDRLNFPAGLALWPIEPLNGLLAVALPGVPLVVVANLLAVLNLALTGYCASLLGWELSERRVGAHLTGLLLPSGSFALFTLHVGVGELQHLWLLPLGAWALLRALRARRFWAVLPAGVLLGLSGIVCFYYAFFLAFSAAFVSLTALVDRERRGAWPRLLAVALLAAAVLVPTTLAFRQAYAGLDDLPEAILGPEADQPNLDIEPPDARLLPEHLLFGQIGQWNKGDEGHNAYLGGRLVGLPLLVLAGIGLWRRPRAGWGWAALALVGVVFALGSHLSTGLLRLPPLVERIFLPFYGLNFVLARFLEPLHFPVRFLALTWLGLCALAALAVRGMPRRWLPWLGLAAGLEVIDIQARQLLPWPLPRFPLPEFACLESAPLAPGPVFDLSSAWWRERGSHARTLAAQIALGRPIQSVPIERLEFFDRDGKLLGDSLPLVVDLKAWTDAVREDLPPTFSTEDWRRDLWLLRDAGFVGVLAMAQAREVGVRDQLDQIMRGMTGPAVAVCGPAALYPLPEQQVSAEQAAAWRAWKAQAVESARARDVLWGL